jgi:hypothetical protein
MTVSAYPDSWRDFAMRKIVFIACITWYVMNVQNYTYAGFLNVVNGSFENPVLPSTDAHQFYYTVQPAPVDENGNVEGHDPPTPGWSYATLGNDPFAGGGVWNMNAANFGLYPANSAPDGNQVGWIGNARMWQDVPAVGPGLYTLGFYVGTGFGRKPDFTAELLADGSPVAVFSTDDVPQGSFEHISLGGLVPAGTSVIRIQFISSFDYSYGGDANSSESEVDIVTLASVPEPSSLMMLCLGIISVYVTARYRHKWSRIRVARLAV